MTTVARKVATTPSRGRASGTSARAAAAKAETTKRQDDRVRVFAAFEPRPGRGPFAESWWGQAWITALEDTSLDSGRLARGRSYARGGAVDAIAVRPGRVEARVHGSRSTPYRTTVEVPELDDEEWNRLLDAVAARSAHIAALLDKDMPPELIEDAEHAGVTLLPAAGGIQPNCSCPDWGYPCKHAAALCYQVARLLDVDPFVLLLLRGRSEPEILVELQRRNAARAAAETAGDPVHLPAQRGAPSGIPARDAFAAWRERTGRGPIAPSPLPEALDGPGSAPVLATATQPDGIDNDALEILATDAVHRAKALLDGCLSTAARATEPDPATPAFAEPALAGLSEWWDAARLSAAHPNLELFARLCGGTGRRPTDLAIATHAWRQGGPAGLEVLDEPWSPPAADLAKAHVALNAGMDAADLPDLREWRNRWTAAGHGVQLRYGRDGRWYPYRQKDSRWWPDGPPDPDPSAVLAGLLR